MNLTEQAREKGGEKESGERGRGGEEGGRKGGKEPEEGINVLMNHH